MTTDDQTTTPEEPKVTEDPKPAARGNRRRRTGKAATTGEEVLTIAKPHGVEAVYEKDASGTVTRTVRRAKPTK